MNIKFNQRNLKLGIAAGILLGSAGFSTAIFAGTATDNLNVTTDVGISCSIEVADIQFDSYDPTYGVNNNSTGSVTSTCTTGGAVVLTLGESIIPGDGSTAEVPVRQMTSGGNTLAYGLFQEIGHTTVFGNSAGTGHSFTASGGADVITVFGSIPKNQSVAIGSYVDSVSVTLTY